MEQQELFVQMALKAWNQQVSRAARLFEAFDDAGLQKEIAPGRNRLIYLLGHLIAVNDSMLGLFGLGERLYAHLDEAFVKRPDRSAADMPDAATLRADWQRSIDALDKGFASLSSAAWFEKHTAMSEEDHLKDPGRNKLSVLLNRTNHMAYHLGQMVLANA